MEVEAESLPLDQRLAGLSPAKRAFVEQRLLAVRPDVSLAAIGRRNGDEPAPLSFAQEVLWDIERSAPGLSTYNVPAALRVRGELDRARLQAALDGLVRRHETLRTTFAQRGGQSVQLVGVPRSVELHSLDLSGAGAQAEQLASELRVAAGRSFDLARDLLLRATLVRLAANEHVLLLVWHHAATDAASRDILLRDLAALYDAPAGEPFPQMQPLPLNYADFAVWQRRRLSPQRLTALQAYWSVQLADAPAKLDLPADRPWTALPTFEGARLRRSFGHAAATRVLAFSRANRVTPFVTLLAAFQTLLHRYSRQDDVVVASVFSGRGRPELDGIVGCFSNVVPLRARFHAGLTFAELVRQVRETYLAAAEHADMPFEKLAERHAGSAAAPAQQAMFSLREDAGTLPNLGGATLERVAVDRGTSKIDLTVGLQFGHDGLEVEVEYRTDRFEPATLRRLVGHFETLLASCLATPALPVASCAMLPAWERTRLVTELNASAADFPSELTVVDLVEAQVNECSARAAVSDATTTLTYAELEAGAERVAHHLRVLGVRPGVLVAVALERSASLVVGLLGVLKAGGAYVPLDPAFPRARLAATLADCGAQVVLTQHSLQPFVASVIGEAAGSSESECAAAGRSERRHEALRHAEFEHATSARFAAPPSLLTLEAALAPATEAALAPASVAESGSASSATASAAATDTAYLIYTSGSTGRPKGVAVTHRSLVNFLMSMRREPGIDARDTLLAVTTLSFDIAGLELWLPLIAGARVVVADRAAAGDGERLAALLDSSEATLLQATPATWRLLLEAGWTGRPSLRMLCGGEALPRDLATELLRRGRALWNMYGPTETTIWSAVQRVEADAPIRIGKPVANTQLYVLEPGGDVAPLGIAGELYVGGEGVALGYHGRPGLTGERFVADFFDGRLGARLYRTGDLVRRHADGSLEFLGRLDDQVKLRGFRIELGEIEAAVAAYDDIEQAVVVLCEDETGARLIAYYVAAAGAVRAADVRRALATRLPEYMLPAQFVCLERLPLTVNGKVDRKALPFPGATPPARTPSAPPQTPLEVDVAATWSDFLNVAGVGRDDHFFELGGHSLLAVRMLNVVNERFAVRVTLAALFEAPTVAGIACAVELQLNQRFEGARARAAVPIPHRRERGLAPLTYGQESLWVLEQRTPGSAAYIIPMLFRITGPLDPAALETALGALVARHEPLRTTFAEVGGEPQAVVLGDVAFRLGRFDVTGGPDTACEREERARKLLAVAAGEAFDLARGPLFRATLATLGEREHLLLLSVHHIVFDGGSVRVLLRELDVCYRAACRAAQPDLAPLPIEYGDYAVWQRSELHETRFQQELEYWRGELERAPQALDLPRDRPRSSAACVAGARCRAVLPLDVLRALKALARAHDATLYMVLLAGFQALLHRYSAQDDIVVGSPLAGRTRLELEGLIGYFVSSVPLRARFDADTTFVDLLAQARRSSLAAHEHQDVPCAAAASPYSVMFVLQDAAAGAGPLGEATLQPLPFDSGAAAFDLVLSTGEQSGGLRTTLHYRTDVFDSATVARMLEHFELLLRAVGATPGAKIATLPLLTPHERTRLTLPPAPQAATLPPRAVPTLPELFEAQAAVRPDAIAVSYKAEQFTYGELEAQANRLAHRLQHMGVGPGVPVGICLERSLELVVAILGVLKAGGFYLPLDPKYPPERLRSLVNDARPRLVVTNAAARAHLADATALVLLDDLRAWPEPATVPTLRPSADDLAYVMYTSGSSGEPKGVMVTHRNVARLLTAAERDFEFGERDVWTLFHSYAFDFSVWEMWGALAYGGRLVVVPHWVSRSAADFRELLLAQRVTVLNQTPSAFRELLRADATQAGLLIDLRYVIFGGERLEPARLAAWFERYGDARPQLVNMYGITETTVHVTVRPLHARDVAGAVRSPIGHALSDLALYVLDAAQGPVSAGLPGELYVGGPGVALGYLNRPELTAERFVPDPIHGAAAGPLYRTGDRVRRRLDGELEFMGRVDRQVKMSGYRIEPAEIEAALLALPGMREAAVVPHEDAAGERSLCAYCVDGAQPVRRPDELRRALAARLPAYLVPSRFVTLNALPLSANGKVDRAALPSPRYAAAPSSDPAAPPPSEVEAALMRIVSEVLGCEDFGVDADFFELGGHSLHAMRVIARVEKLFRASVPLRRFFERPTIAALAHAVEAGEAKPGQTAAIARALATLERMSPDERQRRLQAMRSRG